MWDSFRSVLAEYVHVDSLASGNLKPAIPQFRLWLEAWDEIRKNVKSEAIDAEKAYVQLLELTYKMKHLANAIVRSQDFVNRIL